MLGLSIEIERSSGFLDVEGRGLLFLDIGELRLIKLLINFMRRNPRCFACFQCILKRFKRYEQNIERLYSTEK